MAVRSTDSAGLAAPVSVDPSEGMLGAGTGATSAPASAGTGGTEAGGAEASGAAGFDGLEHPPIRAATTRSEAARGARRRLGRGMDGGKPTTKAASAGIHWNFISAARGS